MTTLVLTLHFLVCFVLITVVLLQRGKGAGMGAALGGGGANTVFGGRGAGNFLTKLTTGTAILFMGTSLFLSYFATPSTVSERILSSVPAEAPLRPELDNPDAPPPPPSAEPEATNVPSGFEELPAQPLDATQEAEDTGLD
jgi:preprotein translocase subunit SecG